MTLNDLCFGNQNFFKDISANVAKEILKGNTPVYRSKSIHKDEILLTEHFDETLHIALSNDSIARMSKAESSIFLDFIKPRETFFLNLGTIQIVSLLMVFYYIYKIKESLGMMKHKSTNDE